MFQFTNLLLKVFNFRIFYFLMRVGAVYKPTFDISGKELACFRVSLVTELTITIGQVWTHDIYMLFWAVFSILAISVFEMATNNVFHSQMSWSLVPGEFFCRFFSFLSALNGMTGVARSATYHYCQIPGRPAREHLEEGEVLLPVVHHQ